jgi:FAD/FMN-containing dehydrogenase
LRGVGAEHGARGVRAHHHGRAHLHPAAGPAEVLPAAASRLVAALRPWISPETNINFTTEPLASAPHIAPWSPATSARLEQIRRRYDPDGLFAPPPVA